MNPGAVSFQREGHWCGVCGRIETAVRAVRLSDNWHSDWTCVHAVLPDLHLRPVEPPPAPRAEEVSWDTFDAEDEADREDAQDSAQADLFDSPARTDHFSGTRELLDRLQARRAKRSAEHTNCGAVDPIADFVCVRAAGHSGVHRSPHGGVTWALDARTLDLLREL